VTPTTSVLTGAPLHLAAQRTTVESPLPGGIAAVVRFMFNLPSWLQITGFVLGVLVAAAVAFVVWRNRRALWHWAVDRPRGAQLALAGTVGLVLLVAAGGGAASWHYMQHDNGFCTGCHVMTPAYGKFVASKHDSLECHQCHQQSIFASARQLYLWVAERPDKIGKHAKVPNRVCAGCHVNGDKARWKQIAQTAGHRVHFESDSSVLKNLQCVTCHGVEVHAFHPETRTCGQSGCHDQLKITLGKMAGQTELHCTTCHKFTADVPALATRDSARGTLVPKMKQCLGCHQMQTLLTFDAVKDPHAGTCGDCHNPHTQTRPSDAAKACVNCHVTWRAIPFHVGKAHRAIGQDCITCHQPHQARVDPSDCAGCHAAVRARKAGRLQVEPPLPFDTTRALKASGISFNARAEPPPRGKGDAPVADLPPPPRPTADTFPHDRHKALACITCHASTTRHGALTFEPPRGCQICHHQAPATADCARCHAAADLGAPRAVAIQVAVRGAPVRTHDTTFAHAVHQKLRCLDCHTTPVTLAPADSVKDCAACHADHHRAGRTCAGCHVDTDTPAVRAAHAPPSPAHQACGSCHPAAIVQGLTADRELCLTCHQAQRDHFAPKACATCHLQAHPDSLALGAAGGRP
jgi:hypothetical protein